MILDKIKGPEDIKKLNIDDLNILAKETRNAVINRVSKKGGHIGPNLGVVELTIAFHYVFNSPKDKIVFDVSHQSYPHKILTGRQNAFLNDDNFSDVTGYTNPKESPHDQFIVGHTSTSISLALGLAKARDVLGTKENIIAFIGDGSLSGGQALEALDYAGEYDKNLIIIVNDNDQSIAENHGGIYKTLKELRENNGVCKNNIFKAMSLDYRYLDEGHDISKLIKFLNDAKDIDHPIVLHIHTIKGKGLKYAEIEKERFHAGGPFNVVDGTPLKKGSGKESIVARCVKELLDTNSKAIAINAATPTSIGIGLDVREKYLNRGQFIDVGIAEENAVGIAAGIAKNGGIPVFGTMAPFFQRTYDQMTHDVCLNDLPATFLIISPGVFGMTSNTHICLTDIQIFSHIPNLIYLAPTTEEEFVSMFKYATTQRNHPVAIRCTRGLKETNIKDDTNYSIIKSKIINKGKDIAIIAVSSLIYIAKEVAQYIKDKYNKDITIINPVFLSHYDYDLLNSLEKDHKTIITIEDGELIGGYGSNIALYYGDKDIKVLSYGISKEFHTDYNPIELLDKFGISKEKLSKVIEKELNI